MTSPDKTIRDSETPRTDYIDSFAVAGGPWHDLARALEIELNAANAKLATARDDVAMRSAVYLIYLARLAAGKMKFCNSNPPHAEVDWFMEVLNELDAWCSRFGVVSLDCKEMESALAPLRSLKSSSGG